MSSLSPTRAPRISVIMPSYNTAKLIAGCLDSVFHQTFQDFEVVLVNDGSPDTPELERVLAPYLDKYSSQIVYIRQSNKRCAGARNTAIRQARGEFLAFLDSDDQWLPEHLSAQMKMFDDDPSLDLVYANGVSVGNPKLQHEFMEWCPSIGPATFEALVLERCHISVSTVVARKSVFERAGLFDESLVRCDDYDMWIRAAFHGAKIAYTTTVQARLNGGRPDSLGSSRAKMTEAYWQILKNALKNLPLSEADRAMLQAQAEKVHALYLLDEGKYRLQQEEFEQARTCLREANRHLRRPKVSLTLAGLAIAPRATGKLASFVERVQLWGVRHLSGRR
ncbi:MAG TPA: glycosyltransferase family A protein [Candidatus Binatia bacterium]|nr:glycosyltransferase family A protein [Candidatus Binatia bacterium]